MAFFLTKLFYVRKEKKILTRKLNEQDVVQNSTSLSTFIGFNVDF